jgi:DNA polymerase-3 subunit epsilon
MRYVIVDVETTGGSPKHSKITEIAMFKYDGEKIIDEFVTLINPEQSIPEFIVRLTGITDKMVEAAPKFYEVAKPILAFFEGCIFVAHNVSFDYGMLRSEFRALGYDFRLPHLCTVRATRIILPGHPSYSLGKITQSLGIEIQGRHRAGGDALATAKLFDIIYHKDPNHLQTFIQKEVNPQKIHPNLSIETIDELPNKAGIYKFFNEFNQLIYIGKSKSIKKRVEQHLRNVLTPKGTLMIQEIAKVEYELTGSELIAMLLESELIKEHKPKFNRQLRKTIFTYGLYDEPDEHGYLSLKLGLTSKNNANPITYFNSRKESNVFIREKGDAFRLCQKINGVYPTNDACFRHSIQECDGACIGAEPVESYNQKVNQLIQSMSFSESSFYILDKGRTKIEKSIVWIEKGVYQGHGFAPYHFHGTQVQQWKRYIDKKDENRDIKSIVNLYLRKGEGIKIIDL